MNHHSLGVLDESLRLANLMNPINLPAADAGQIKLSGLVLTE